MNWLDFRDRVRKVRQVAQKVIHIILVYNYVAAMRWDSIHEGRFKMLRAELFHKNLCASSPWRLDVHTVHNSDLSNTAFSNCIIQNLTRPGKREKHNFSLRLWNVILSGADSCFNSGRPKLIHNVGGIVWQNRS